MPPGALGDEYAPSTGDAASTVFTRLTNMLAFAVLSRRGVRPVGDGQIEQVRDSRKRTELGLTNPPDREDPRQYACNRRDQWLAARHRNDIPATLLKQVSQHVAAGRMDSHL